ncbi:hypothetical protein B9Z55_007909 [Caenorhabditis nigoni]|uniref:Uncharacterized protein n=1 Tax=Caenorhabditis nigoni TaxID=1611254 RepID=A0A2G5VBX4_9PELO|nr:hypothetical protein B9Z55_007909 [Caenorhabditis nigoni]
MEIHPMLQRLLNSESQRNLMHLDISGFEGSFTPKWVGPITEILPSGKQKYCKQITGSPTFGNFENWNFEN